LQRAADKEAGGSIAILLTGISGPQHVKEDQPSQKLQNRESAHLLLRFLIAAAQKFHHILINACNGWLGRPPVCDTIRLGLRLLHLLRRPQLSRLSLLPLQGQLLQLLVQLQTTIDMKNMSGILAQAHLLL
jgi:hypothetical protein